MISNFLLQVSASYTLCSLCFMSSWCDCYVKRANGLSRLHYGWSASRYNGAVSLYTTIECLRSDWALMSCCDVASSRSPALSYSNWDLHSSGMLHGLARLLQTCRQQTHPVIGLGRRPCARMALRVLQVVMSPFSSCDVLLAQPPQHVLSFLFFALRLATRTNVMSIYLTY